MKNSALVVAGIIFTLVCALHIVRFYNEWTIVIAGIIIPQQASIYGGLITAILAIWMFAAARK